MTGRQNLVKTATDQLENAHTDHSQVYQAKGPGYTSKLPQSKAVGQGSFAGSQIGIEKGREGQSYR